MIKVLFIGDIVGKIGRDTVTKILPKFKKEKKIDLVIANAENSAHGSGITERIIIELEKAGIDFFTMGDHALRRKNEAELYKLPNIIRPANFPPSNPGSGFSIIEIKSKKILVISLIGRVFMKYDYDCPFRKIDEILANNSLLASDIFAIIVDIHAEATSEKISLFHYLDNRVNAILGTHTHVQTADEFINKNGTAYITDVGMTGASDSSIGIDKNTAIKNFLSQVKTNHIIPEKGEAIFNAVIIELNEKDAKCKKIKRISNKIIIN